MHFDAAKSADSTATAAVFAFLLGCLKAVSVPAVPIEFPVSVARR